MSHPEQIGFFSIVAAANRRLTRGARILEIGSYDVNGRIRPLFAGAMDYVGVDLRAGQGVDVVAFGHELDDPDASYDVALSGECFEHDPHWQQTFTNMARMTRPGGLVAFSCASRGRTEHGTARSMTTLSPGTQSLGLDYYRNLERGDFERAFQLSDIFSQYRFWYLPTHFDLFFAGIRKGDSGGRPVAEIPDDAEVRDLRSLMPLRHKVGRLPLRILSKVLPENSYQAVALPYRKWALKLTPERMH